MGRIADGERRGQVDTDAQVALSTMINGLYERDAQMQTADGQTASMAEALGRQLEAELTQLRQDRSLGIDSPAVLLRKRALQALELLVPREASLASGGLVLTPTAID